MMQSKTSIVSRQYAGAVIGEVTSHSHALANAAKHERVRNSVAAAQELVASLFPCMGTANPVRKAPYAEAALPDYLQTTMAGPQYSRERRAFLASISRYAKENGVCAVVIHNQRRIDTETQELVSLKGGDDFTSASHFHYSFQHWYSLELRAPEKGEAPAVVTPSLAERREPLSACPGHLVFGHRTWTSVFHFDGLFGEYERGGSRTVFPDGSGKMIFNLPLTLRPGENERWVYGVERVN